MSEDRPLDNLELTRCLRRCDDLDARLRHSTEIQRKIRQEYQQRLLESKRLLQSEGESAMQLRNELISQMELHRLQHDSEVSELRGVIVSLKAENQQLIERSQVVLHQCESNIAEMKIKLDECVSDKKNLHDQVEQVLGLLNATSLELQSVYKSLSWRVFAPLRWCKSLIIGDR